MPNYTKLFNSIVTSTIWTEDDKTRIVWITMLALSNQHGEVMASIPGLARVAGVSVDDCEAAIVKFLSPDKYSRTADHEGRRALPINGGWELLNHAKYRAMASREDTKNANAERQRKFKERQKGNASVTQGNASVTQNMHIADTDADADADTKTKTKKSKAKAFSCAGFEDFWEAYPRRLGKVDAENAFRKATKTATIEEILNAIQSQKQTDAWIKDGGQFIPYPATWLNKGHWMNEVEGQTKAPKPPEIPAPDGWEQIYEPMDDRAYYDPDGAYQSPEWSQLTSKEKAAVIAASNP